MMICLLRLQAVTSGNAGFGTILTCYPLHPRDASGRLVTSYHVVEAAIGNGLRTLQTMPPATPTPMT